MKSFLSSFTFLSALSVSAPAYAHWGHVGELAGHGHLIGIGAIAAAAALAALLLKPESDEADAEEDEEEGGEAELEAA